MALYIFIYFFCFESEPHQSHQLPSSPILKQQSEYEPIRLKNEQSNDSMTSMTNLETQNSPINTTNTNKSPVELEENKDLLNNMKAMWENTLAATQSGDFNSSEQGRLGWVNVA